MEDLDMIPEKINWANCDIDEHILSHRLILLEFIFQMIFLECIFI